MNNLTQAKAQKGFTLTELMIAVMLGMSVISSVLIGYLATYSGSVNTLANSKLSQEMTTLMNLMVEDIRRAGYSNAFATPSSNPFSSTVNTSYTALTALASGTTTPLASNTATGSCILYSYDRNEDGLVDTDEFFGFRLTGTAVEMRYAGALGAPTCAGGATEWTAVTDTRFMNVSELNFSLAASQCINNREPDGIDNGGAGGIDDAAEINCYTNAPVAGNITTETRQITIRLTANLTGDSFVQMSMEQDVRVRNDMVRVR